MERFVESFRTSPVKKTSRILADLRPKVAFTPQRRLICFNNDFSKVKKKSYNNVCISYDEYVMDFINMLTE